MHAAAVSVDIDHTPRYAPETVIICRRGKVQSLPVLRYIVHPPGTHPNSPMIDTCTALECVTEAGSRWYGFEKAWINSELRMIVEGFSARDEVQVKWPVCDKV